MGVGVGVGGAPRKAPDGSERAPPSIRRVKSSSANCHCPIVEFAGFAAIHASMSSIL